MGKEKYSLKEELKEELRESSNLGIRPEDLEIDKNIDDKYTSSALDRYKNGHTKNNWFTWSGILSILFGVACIVIMIVIGIVFVSSSESLKELASQQKYDYDAEKTKVIVCCIIIPIIGIIGILVGLKIKSYSNYSKEELIEHLGSIIGFSILQFLFGGVIFTILTLVGYFVGIGSDYGVIYYNRIDNASQKHRKLMDAKMLYQNELIDYEEYARLKNNILRQSDSNNDYYD